MYSVELDLPTNLKDTDILSYILCFSKPKQYRFAWSREYVEENKELAIQMSVAAELVECKYHRLRPAALELIPHNYRRFEDSCKQYRLVQKGKRKFIEEGYGKLTEWTVYLYYKSSKKRSWDRKWEVKLLIPFPLHISGSGYRAYSNIVVTLAREAVTIEYNTLEDYADEITVDEVKVGMRIPTAREGADTWCNGAERVRLSEPIEVTIIDDRGYVYDVTFTGGWCRWFYTT